MNRYIHTRTAVTQSSAHKVRLSGRWIVDFVAAAVAKARPAQQQQEVDAATTVVATAFQCPLAEAGRVAGKIKGGFWRQIFEQAAFLFAGCLFLSSAKRVNVFCFTGFQVVRDLTLLNTGPAHVPLLPVRLFLDFPPDATTETW